LRKLLQEQREKDEKKEQEKNKTVDQKEKPINNKSNPNNNDMMYDLDDDAINLIQKVEDKLEQIK